jgi:hypothetical protein
MHRHSVSVDFGIGVTVSLTEKGLNINFSTISYHDIARMVGLDPLSAGKDMSTFEIHRARIPTSLFKLIIGDFEIIMNQYGEQKA